MQQEIQARIRRQMALKDAQVQINKLDQAHKRQRMQIRTLAQQLAMLVEPSKTSSVGLGRIRLKEELQADVPISRMKEISYVLSAMHNVHDDSK
eukprot:gene22350-29443_t